MGEKLYDRDALASQPADGDFFHVVDVSDTTDSPEGTSKKILYSNLIPDASTTVEGKVELATDAETITGTDTVRVMTPANLTAKIDTDGTLAGNLDTRIPSQKAVKTYVTNNGFNGANFFAPRGFLLNGKFVVTDTGSGINIAIKTSAGTDPTSSDITYIRIGDTTRQITSALSVTLADGTNWFNAGSAELATKEIDYFLYAVWDSNSSAVALGFARIPGANLVSDFSATTTNEKYIAGYSGFTTTDEVENIGRFAATLSAGAGYTWTVPTFTAANLIQRPIYETRWLDFTPGLAVSGGTPPTYTSVFSNRYKIESNKTLLEGIWVNAAGGTVGVGTNAITGTLPFSLKSTLFVSFRSSFGHGHYFETGAGSTITIASNTAANSFLFLKGSTSVIGTDQDQADRMIGFTANYEI